MDIPLSVDDVVSLLTEGLATNVPQGTDPFSLLNFLKYRRTSGSYPGDFTGKDAEEFCRRVDPNRFFEAYRIANKFGLPDQYQHLLKLADISSTVDRYIDALKKDPEKAYNGAQREFFGYGLLSPDGRPWLESIEEFRLGINSFKRYFDEIKGQFGVFQHHKPGSESSNPYKNYISSINSPDIQTEEDLMKELGRRLTRAETNIRFCENVLHESPMEYAVKQRQLLKEILGLPRSQIIAYWKSQ